MSLFSKIGLTPSAEYKNRLKTASHKKYDQIKRITLLISLLLTVLGILLIGVSCAYSSIHPMIGCALFIGSIIGFISGASLPMPPPEDV